MGFTLHVRNLRALRVVEWPADGVVCLVGANGSGKTTLILAVRFLRAAFERGLSWAVRWILGGSYELRHRAAGEGESIEIGVEVDGLRWHIGFVVRAGGIVEPVVETLSRGSDRGSEEILRRDGTEPARYRGQRVDGTGGERPALAFVASAHPDDEDVQTLARFLRNMHAFHDPDLFGLRSNGSRATDDMVLHARAQNVFAMLKLWHMRREHRHRYEFVVDGLRAAFPALCEDIDFAEAGQTVVVRTFRPGDDAPMPIAQEANGLLALLVQLSCVACAEPGGVVAIDEPENALHPFAIRALVRRTRQWAERHDLTVLFTTHSPVVLNCFNGEPERIFVLEQAAEPLPIRLDQHKNREWLADFELGDLYSNYEFGYSVSGGQ